MITKTDKQKQLNTKIRTFHWPQMKITDNTLYDIYATFRPEATEVMTDLGNCVQEAILDCQRNRMFTTDAYISNVKKHIQKYPRIAVNDFDVKVDKLDQYGNPWEDWMDGKSIFNKENPLSALGDKHGNTTFFPVPLVEEKSEKMPSWNTFWDPIKSAEKSNVTETQSGLNQEVFSRLDYVSEYLKDASKPEKYKVVKGDSLWKISEKYLGDGSRYQELLSLNKNKGTDFELIHPGQIIILPDEVKNAKNGFDSQKLQKSIAKAQSIINLIPKVEETNTRQEFELTLNKTGKVKEILSNIQGKFENAKAVNKAKKLEKSQAVLFSALLELDNMEAAVNKKKRELITDNQLAMIEQLTYIKDAADAVDVDLKLKGGKSIAYILNQFTEDALKKLESLGNEEISGALVSGAEWASIIRYLKSDKDISELVLGKKKMRGKVPLILTFHRKGDLKEAIVAFKGTTDTSEISEWADNVEGLISYDTKAQEEAFNFIEGLKYSDITVIGHSKGGNKAIYTAIRSDKVTRAVSYDGQGFSQQFLDKYQKKIKAKAKNIKNYSLSTDFVNVLMFPIPEAELIWTRGYGVDSVGQNHSPNSFFVTDENGRLKLDADGRPQMEEIPQDESMKKLHEFVNFLMNISSFEDKQDIVKYVSELVKLMFGDKSSSEKIIDHIISAPDTLAMIAAYLVKYMYVYDLDENYVRQLVNSLGLDSLDNFLTFYVPIIDPLYGNINYLKIDGFAALIGLMKSNLTDKAPDSIIEWALGNFAPYGIDLKDLWEKVESKINEIGDVNPETANKNAQPNTKMEVNVSYNINCINEFEPKLTKQEVLKVLPFQLRTRIIPDEDKIFRWFYNKLVNKLEQDLSASSAGVYT